MFLLDCFDLVTSVTYFYTGRVQLLEYSYLVCIHYTSVFYSHNIFFSITRYYYELVLVLLASMHIILFYLLRVLIVYISQYITLASMYTRLCRQIYLRGRYWWIHT